MAYINKEATIKELEKTPAYFESGDIRYGIIVAIDTVEKQAPAADVVEVRHGRLEKLKDGYWCSNCCILEKDLKQEYNYCPNRGAKMDGKDGE